MIGDDSNVHFVDIARAQDLARRYRCEFIDLRDFGVPLDVLKKVPVTAS